jgi:hypothetical protein
MAGGAGGDMSACSCDAEEADVVRHEYRRARKPHRCYECGARIVPGERYEHTGMVYDRTASSHATCLGCVEIRAALAKVCRCWSFGAVLDCAKEHLGDRFEHPRTEAVAARYAVKPSPVKEWADFGRLAGVVMRRAEERRAW